MPVFENTEKMYEVLGGLFRGLMDNPEVLKNAMDAKITILFSITEPSGQIWLSHEKGDVICGPSNLKPDVTMTLSGDSCHNFWLKKLSLPVAIATRKIKTQGPIQKVLKLLPLLKPAHEAYPEIAKKYNLPM
ncbi:MAG: SCP2 sterol-binding domain-containing protein [Deltaproteobacteria bacterium]|nr:SCP2 sterol-binding domain-containing protein [Deltaproteobacteria bacterium]